MLWIVLGTFAVWMAWYVVTLQAERRRIGGSVALVMVLRLNRAFCRLRLGLCPPRRDPLPRRGAAILVANHTSSADPFLLGATTGRVVSFVMAGEYFGLPIAPIVFRLTQVIPVNRDGRDVAGTKATLRALRQGRVVGMFPEGRINMEAGLLDPKPGVAMLAVKTGVPVIPAYIHGTRRGAGMAEAFLRGGGRVRIRFGSAIDLTDFRHRPRTRELLLAVAHHMMRAVADLEPHRP